MAKRNPPVPGRRPGRPRKNAASNPESLIVPEYDPRTANAEEGFFGTPDPEEVQRRLTDLEGMIETHRSAGWSLEKEMLAGLVSTFYQIQKVRIQTGNKVVAHFYNKLGVERAEKLIEQKKGVRKTAVDFIDVLREQHKRIADALSDVKLLREGRFLDLAQDRRGVFDSFSEYNWMINYNSLLVQEGNTLKEVLRTLERFPIWTEFLSKIKGFGPTMGGVVVSFVDIYKADTPASLWAYAGLDVVTINNKGEEDGRGRGRYKEHLVLVNYENREGKNDQRWSVTFNPFLKTKLVGVLADIFIKMNTPRYKTEYDNYKARITAREIVTSAADAEYTPKRPIHIERMAKRYMIKRLLVDIYKVWREMEGLEVVPEYSERRLDMTHHHGRGRWATFMRNGPSTPQTDHPDRVA